MLSRCLSRPFKTSYAVLQQAPVARPGLNQGYASQSSYGHVPPQHFTRSLQMASLHATNATTHNLQVDMSPCSISLHSSRMASLHATTQSWQTAVYPHVTSPALHAIKAIGHAEAAPSHIHACC